MTINVVIPVRSLEEGKSRLAGILDARARAALVERMFGHVLSVALDFAGHQHCHVVSRSSALLDLAKARGANIICEADYGLNQCLAQATGVISPDFPVLVAHADLPFLKVADLVAMADALTKADVVAASDDAGCGTNALLLRRPGLIPYAFGEDSLMRHRALAESGGLRFAHISRSGLSRDIDEPADLAFLSAAMLSLDCAPELERQTKREACH